MAYTMGHSHIKGIQTTGGGGGWWCINNEIFPKGESRLNCEGEKSQKLTIKLRAMSYPWEVDASADHEIIHVKHRRDDTSELGSVATQETKDVKFWRNVVMVMVSDDRNRLHDASANFQYGALIACTNSDNCFTHSL